MSLRTFFAQRGIPTLQKRFFLQECANTMKNGQIEDASRVSFRLSSSKSTTLERAVCLYRAKYLFYVIWQLASRLSRAESSEKLQERYSKYQRYEKPTKKRQRMKSELKYKHEKEKVRKIKEWIEDNRAVKE